MDILKQFERSYLEIYLVKTTEYECEYIVRHSSDVKITYDWFIYFTDANI